MSMNLDLTNIDNFSLYFQIVVTSNIPIIITDVRQPDNPVVFINEAFEQVTGYSSTEVLGRNCRFLQGDDKAQQASISMAKAIEEGIPCKELIRNYRKNGELFWNEIYIFPIKNPQGHITHFVGIQSDVTNLLLANEGLHEKNLAIQNSLDIFLKVKNDGTILEANRACYETFGWTVEELIGNSIYVLVPDYLKNKACQDFTKLLDSETPTFLTSELICKHGKIVFIEWTLTVAKGNSIHFFGRDSTEKRALLEKISTSEKKLLSILESLTEGFFSLDRNWCFNFINNAGTKLLNKQADELIGKNLWEVYPETIGSIFSENYHRAMTAGESRQFESYYEPLKSWFDVRANPSSDGITVLFQDITERKHSEHELLFIASHDSLTGLNNRATCLNKLEKSLKQDGNMNGISVLFIDLDRFKEINDAYGHRFGDSVLKNVGVRLGRLQNDQITCARISGDEFLFFFPGFDISHVEKFSRDILSIVSKPMIIEGLEITIGCSIGIAIHNGSDISADDLINKADTAMYAAKASGRHIYKWAEKDDETEIQRHRLRSELLSAINGNQFILYYQPQIHLETGKIVGVEALIRWQHPHFGMLAPGAFITLAEESPIIFKLGEWVFDEACRQLALWNRLGFTLKMSINISAKQLNDPTLINRVDAIIVKYGLSPDCIELEVTESMLVQDFATTSKILEPFKQKGYRIALDDFGTGYSNFSYLNSLPITAIKIDRSFLRNIESDWKAIAVINGIIALGKSLDLTVITEGIETESEYEIIKGTKCDQIQGYFISRPLPAKELAEKFINKK